MRSAFYIGKVAEMEEPIDKMWPLVGSIAGPATCQILSENSITKRLKAEASGFFAELGGVHYLFTASHVAEIFNSEENAFIKIHEGFVSIVGDLRETDIKKSGGIDLAYIKLDPEIIQPLKKAYKFLTIDDFQIHGDLDKDRIYGVAGFPTHKTKYVDGKLHQIGQIYFVKPSDKKVYEYSKVNEVSHYVTQFEGRGINVLSGEKVKVNSEPHGLSGCGLWSFELYTTLEGGEKWEAKLIGLMSEYKKGKYHCLIGIQIKQLLHGLHLNEGLRVPKKIVRIK